MVDCNFIRFLREIVKMEIPLILRLKKERHKEIARAQDLIIETLYKVFDRVVLHGGTAIWRCYHGNRFSEDIDVYIPKDIKKIEILFSNFEKIGFVIERKKIGENSLYSNLRFNNVIVRFEALFKQIHGILKDYETIDGNFATIYTLSSEEIINEKILTYMKRLKIRDLYDIFFLLRYIQDTNKIESNIKIFLKEFKQPIDKEELKVLILFGLIPKTDEMLNYIKSFAKWDDKNI